jgi:hypothetical protein
MAHCKGLNTSNKLLFRVCLLLFMVLLSSHLSGNELSAQHKQRLGLATQYTGFSTIDQNRSSPILESKVKNNLPQGNIMRLPQAGTANDLYKKIGFWMLFFAAIFWIIERHFIKVKTENYWQGGANGIIKNQ